MDIVLPSSIHRSNRPLSPLHDNCNSCTNDEKKKGKSLYRSISLCTIQKDKNIQFTYANGVRSTNQVNSRIYVKSGRKSFVKSSGSSMLSTMSSAGDLLGDSTTTASLLVNSFDDENDGGFLPMLPSPVDNSSLFQSSPQCEISKILSSSQDINNAASGSSSMPSLSPFQPIQNKQQNMSYMMTPSKSATGSQEQETCGCLAVGYLLSISEKNDGKTKEHSPEVVKVS